ncbi:MAG: putative AlkP superfamily pyrophosphatase or phosphodiesterase [Planctomycetota bacterium]|jgi:predicted AlkP superfamily pyrophosphatase or phosphodiesterase
MFKRSRVLRSIVDATEGWRRVDTLRHQLMTAVLVLLFGVGLECGLSAQKPKADHALILISIDGFRHDYAELHGAPNLIEMGREGVRADALIPCFPTKTFPNHYTIITGLWAENHGVVGNNMFDPELEETFRLGDPKVMRDGRWWGGEPLWVTAEKQGMRTATMFWVGSEAEIDGIRPTTWLPYQGSMPNEERVDRVLEWLDRSGAERPGFITLYFSSVDTAGHHYGPNSDEVKQAVRDVDLVLKRLFDGIEGRGLTQSTDIVVVSDHGMAELDQDRMIVLDDHVELTREEVLTTTPLLGVWPNRKRSVSQLVQQLDAIPHVQAWARRDLPDRFHWRNNDRIPPVVALADEGWTILRQSSIESFMAANSGGAHGFDNQAASMQGIFMARGPSFRSGLKTPAFDNIHVYPLLVSALGLKSASVNGNRAATEHLLNTTKR